MSAPLTDATLREEQLEQLAKDQGVNKVRKQIQKAREKGLGAETPGGVALLKRAVEPLAKVIDATVEDAKSGRPGRRHVAVKTLDKLPPEVTAYLTTRCAINGAMARSTLQRIAVDIGSLIEEELRLAAFEDTEPALYATIMRQLKERGAGAQHARKVFVFAGNKADIVLPSITRTEKLHVGIRLIELLIEATGFVEVHHERNGKKLKAILRATELAAKWMEHQNVQAELLAPRYAPMVIPPLDWTGWKGGGYSAHVLRQLPLVKGGNEAKRKKLVEAADMSVVLRGLNAIQRTVWCVNGPVLDVMVDVWSRGLDLAMPSRDERELPPKPLDIATNEKARKAWSRAARKVHEENAASRGKRLGVSQIINTATELRDEEAIYFPHQLDFRGRAYAVPIGLNPQGSDYAKALLTFPKSKGKPITTPRAAGWLAINGANLFGYDKASFVDRIDWVTEHEDQIAYTAENPLGDLWWTDADKPWCFLAWCFEYAAFLKEGYGFVSSLPLSVDGSCNGLQHFSAMLRDPIGGAAVNLMQSDLPADIYQRVADRVVWKLEQEKADWVSRAWIDFGINRKITKRPVMVLPYGGTFKSCMDYVRAAVDERIAGGAENPFGDTLSKAGTALSRKVWDSIGDVVVAARQAMDWLQSCARVASKEGHPLVWTAPSGFPVFQAYSDRRHRRVKTRLQGSLVFLSLVEDGDKLDSGKQALAVSPNFVHSLDAAAMMLTIWLALDNGVTQFAMIHDSYGTVAADMDMLSACLRHAFVDMYEDHDVLAEFLQSLPEEVRAKCPALPPKGSLNIQEVHNSEFFFA